ncbi:prepilin-type N-terminal cleavage/methylation domain-containing protein [Elusimicrobium minutum]
MKKGFTLIEFLAVV